MSAVQSRFGSFAGQTEKPWRIAGTLWFVASLGLVPTAQADDLRVMLVGLGSGSVTSASPGISCGADCDQSYGPAAAVTLQATPAAGSVFVRWRGDCTTAAISCTLAMTSDRSVRAEFALGAATPEISDFTPAGLATYLSANPSVSTPARFIDALPDEYKQNWITMTRSESLQTGTAELPRFLLPSPDARFTFSFGSAPSSSYPGSHPSAIEYMQWDDAQKNFRFHEIVLDAIPPMGTVPARTRGVAIDDSKCSRCHSTRNVLNLGTSPGTTGMPIGVVQTKNKPNWDTYDSWAGMLPFNRDRIYQGSVEAAAFRTLFNPWSWRDEPAIRAVIEQLQLQPSLSPAVHAITRIQGGANDGHLSFGFDTVSPVLDEPPPTGSSTADINYSFDNVVGAGAGTSVQRDGSFVTLHHTAIPTSDEGRGVRFFDALGGLAGTLNQSRVADELANHRFATGSVPIDVRPVTLAIAKDCLSIDAGTNTVVAAATPLTIDQAFFSARTGAAINSLVNDTRTRAQSLPRRKADIQSLNLDRNSDLYTSELVDGLIQSYGAATSAGTSVSLGRLRQEVFQRGTDGFWPDATVMGGIYVDREKYAYNTQRIALYRYFLEPLGVAVDKWSMGVRGRSRTYTFADVLETYTSAIITTLEASLASDPLPGLSAPFSCNALVSAANVTLGALPAASAVPTFTDVQRIFNKSCIECHGGLGYPPASEFFPAEYLDLSEDDAAAAVRLARSHAMALMLTTADPATSRLFDRITRAGEECPDGMMPCGGPPLSSTDVETIRRWIVGGLPSTWGDPHLTTVDGTQYDFQSAGEFVLLRDESFELQVRQGRVATEAPLPPDGHTGISTCASLNAAVALRVGPHRISVQPNLTGEPNAKSMELRVDGRLVRIGASGVSLAHGGRIRKTSAPGGLQVQIPGGTDVVITPDFWDYYRVWYLNIDIRHARATEGVMGAIVPGTWLPALPDGDTLGERPSDLHERYDQLYVKFADAWRVNDATSLFDYAAGTSTETFTDRDWPGDSPQSCQVPGQSVEPLQQLPRDAAKDFCGAIDKAMQEHCIQDVMVTGEPGFAETYEAAQRLQLNRVAKPVELRDPGDSKTDLTTRVTFTWSITTDPDQDTLTYLHCLWPSDRQQTFRDCRAVQPDKDEEVMATTVSGLAASQAYSWKVIVDDAHGGTVESATRRFATR